MAEYPSTDEFINWLKAEDGKQPGDPRKAARAIIQVVESNAPLRLPLGKDSLNAIESELEAVRRDISAWRTVSLETAFEGASIGTIGGR